VREYLFKIQKDAGQSCDIVAEGRDMTTVVFPNARVKIYLDASEEGRAARRYRQLNEKGMPITMEEALGRCQRKGFQRQEPGHSAINKVGRCPYLDTTNMGLEAVVDRIIKEAQ